MINYNKVKYIELSNTIENLKENIEKYGVGVIPNVLTSDECKDAINKDNTWLNYKPVEENDKIKIDDKNSWRNIANVLHGNHGGLIQHFNIGQSQYAWDMRQNKKVKDIFEVLWNAKDLIVSFDGTNVTPPPEVTNLGWRNQNKMWLHTDQSHKKIGLQSVQGLVNLVDVDDSDATLCVLLGSNNLHQKFFDENKLETKNDWYKLKNDTEVKWFLDKGCELVAIKAPAGSMIFWDSRTIHMGIAPSKERQHKDRWRYVVYVAMFPRSKLTTKELEKRQKYFKNGRTTNHWGNRLFPKLPRTYGVAVAKMNPYIEPELNEIGKLLI